MVKPILVISVICIATCMLWTVHYDLLEVCTVILYYIIIIIHFDHSRIRLGITLGITSRIKKESRASKIIRMILSHFRILESSRIFERILESVEFARIFRITWTKFLFFEVAGPLFVVVDKKLFFDLKILSKRCCDGN